VLREDCRKLEFKVDEEFGAASVKKARVITFTGPKSTKSL
jgi:hypothetical protein